MDCKLLKEVRVAAGVTQEAMAAAIGYKDKSSYCLLEKGAVKCTVDQAKAIKEALNLSVDMYAQIFWPRGLRILNTREDRMRRRAESLRYRGQWTQGEYL